MTDQRKKLIERFQRWLDTNPHKKIIAAECANIAEQYHKEQLMLGGVVGQSEHFKCDCGCTNHYKNEMYDSVMCADCGTVYALI
jgi:hypothetical protein